MVGRNSADLCQRKMHTNNEEPGAYTGFFKRKTMGLQGGSADSVWKLWKSLFCTYYGEIGTKIMVDIFP